MPNRQSASKNFLIGLFALAWILAGTNCEQSQISTDLCMVWRVSSSAHDGKTIYLGGAVHALRPDDHPLPQVLYRAVDWADLLITETGDSAEDKAALKDVVARGMLPEGQSLNDVLGSEAQMRLAEHLRKFPEHRAKISTMRPWMAQLWLSNRSTTEAGAKSALGADKTLVAYARSAGKAREGLEQVADQLAIFENLKPAQLDVMLIEVLTEFGDDPKGEQLSLLIDAWRRGDLEALNERLAEDAERHADFLDDILDGRNQRFADAIESKLAAPDQQRIFVLVGGLHLVGEQGVPELLRARGLEVERVLDSAEILLVNQLF